LAGVGEPQARRLDVARPRAVRGAAHDGTTSTGARSRWGHRGRDRRGVAIAPREITTDISGRASLTRGLVLRWRPMKHVEVASRAKKPGPDPVVGLGLFLVGLVVMATGGAATWHYVFNVGEGILLLGAVVF